MATYSAILSSPEQSSFSLDLGFKYSNIAARYSSLPCLFAEYIDSLLWSYQFPARRPEQAWQFGRLVIQNLIDDYYHAQNRSRTKCCYRSYRQKSDSSVFAKPAQNFIFIAKMSFLTHFWLISDSFLTHFWLISDSFLTHFWLISDSFLIHFMLKIQI